MRDFTERDYQRDHHELAKENEDLKCEELRLMRLSVNGVAIIKDEYFEYSAPEFKARRLTKKEDAEMKQNLMAVINRIQGK